MTDHFSACDPPLKREAKSVGEERNRGKTKRERGERVREGDGRKEREGGREHIRARMEWTVRHHTAALSLKWVSAE